MKVKWETFPEIQARQKLVVEMTSASGGVDGFFTRSTSRRSGSGRRAGTSR